MSVSVTPLPLIGRHKRTQGRSIDSIRLSDQIPGLIMSPQGTVGNLPDLGKKSLPVRTPCTFRHGGPVKGERSGLCVATLRLERAGIRASALMRGGNGHESRLTISRFRIEVEVFHAYKILRMVRKVNWNLSGSPLDGSESGHIIVCACASL